MTVFDKIREYVFNVSAYPEVVDYIKCEQFVKFLNDLEKEQKTLSPETIEVIREALEHWEYWKVDMVEPYKPNDKFTKAQAEFNAAYGGLK